MNVYPVSAETYRRRRRNVALVVFGLLLLLVFGISRCGGGGDTSTEDSPSADPVIEADFTPSPTATPIPTPDSGPRPEQIITELQTDLTTLGYYSGPINGNYDEATQSAILDFQQANGISAFGVFGAQTAQTIDSTLEREGGSTTLQTTLAGLCLYTDEIDGIYGPATEQALQQLQADAGIDIDGLYGPDTATALITAWQLRPASCPTEAPEEPEPTPEVDAITVVADGVGIAFNNEVSCVLSADLAGSINGTADDGTTVTVTLGGDAPNVVVTGTAGTNDVPVISVTPDDTTLTIEAGTAGLVVTIDRSVCTVG